jgi:predicted RNA-binding Zn ribbon-like protein
VNTRDVMERTDALTSAGALLAWAVERKLLDKDDAVSVSDHHRAIETREALRMLLLANNDVPDPGDGGRALSAVASGAGITLDFGAVGEAPRLVATAKGVDGALATLLLAIYDASRSGEWHRLKACREPTCQWAFYDHSRNHRSHWCTMSMCGGRAKARAYRQRNSRTPAAASRAGTESTPVGATVRSSPGRK